MDDSDAPTLYHHDESMPPIEPGTFGFGSTRRSFMLSDGRKHLSDAWWMPTMPGVALSLVVLATNLMGDWLRVHSDPATKR